MNKILDGKKLAGELNEKLAEKIGLTIKETGLVPKLATILVGEDPASQVYVNIKHKTCKQVGIESLMINLDATISKEDLLQEIARLNEDEGVNGILLQQPLPSELRKLTAEFIEAISPLKDVDGFHPVNRGRLFDYDEELAACTPKGIIALLEHYDIDLKGKNVTIVNRSNLVGKPLIFMFLKRNATPSVCHTSTKDIDHYLKLADIIVVAVGKANFITADRISEGTIIIDVGMNRVDDKLCGDVDFEGVLQKVSWITPVPGGVGPLTVAHLMQNTYTAFLKQLSMRSNP